MKCDYRESVRDAAISIYSGKQIALGKYKAATDMAFEFVDHLVELGIVEALEDESNAANHTDQPN